MPIMLYGNTVFVNSILLPTINLRIFTTAVFGSLRRRHVIYGFFDRHTENELIFLASNCVTSFTSDLFFSFRRFRILNTQDSITLTVWLYFGILIIIKLKIQIEIFIFYSCI